MYRCVSMHGYIVLRGLSIVLQVFSFNQIFYLFISINVQTQTRVLLYMCMISIISIISVDYKVSLKVCKSGELIRYWGKVYNLTTCGKKGVGVCIPSTG